MYVEITEEFISASKVNVYTRDKKKWEGADPSHVTATTVCFIHDDKVYHIPTDNISYLEYYNPTE